MHVNSKKLCEYVSPNFDNLECNQYACAYTCTYHNFFSSCAVILQVGL